MIPLWKVRRELTRLGQQLRAIPEALWEPVAQRRHDAAFARGFPLYPGGVGWTGRAAILLVWQPKGIAVSTLTTCRHLRDNGYAVLLVANAPLSGADRQALAPLVWEMMERPNFGYDFGGYRDGIRHIQRLGLAPERLVILNDSIWFPVWPGDDTLARMEARGVDIAGTVLRHRGDERFLESYAYSISGAVLGHPAFLAFWNGLRLTSNKYKVIRRGERGFSRAMLAAGLRVEGLYSETDFRAGVAGADAPLLRRTLDHAALVDATWQAEAARLAQEGSTEEMRAFILSALEKAQFYSAFPVAAHQLMHYPVLKKSREPVSVVWRAAFLRAVEDGTLPGPLPEVMAEVQAGMGQGRRMAGQ